MIYSLTLNGIELMCKSVVTWKQFFSNFFLHQDQSQVRHVPEKFSPLPKERPPKSLSKALTKMMCCHH